MTAKEPCTTDEAQMKKELTNTFFGLSSDMLGVLDRDGNLLLVNTAWEKTVGWKGEELITRTFLSLIHPEDAENMSIQLKKLKSGLTFVLNSRILCKDGTFVPMRWHGEMDGAERYISVTGSKAADYAENEKALKKARLAVEQADKAKREFLANISHEIRTPLNSVIGFSELLGSSVEGEKNRDYVSSITASARGLLTLLNSILDLSKIEAGMMNIQRSPTDIKRMIFDVEQVFHKEIEDKNLRFTVEYAKETQSSFLLDECRIRQVLINIVGNAVKFTEKGGITIHVNTTKQNHSSLYTDVSISVEDTGIGIPKREQKSVFESFVQQSGQSSRKYGGTGLGLSISSKLVRLMNGELQLKSTVGKGSEFTIILRDVRVEKSALDNGSMQWDLARGVSIAKNSEECAPLDMRFKEYICAEIMPLAEYLGKSVKVSQINQLADILTGEEAHHGSPRLRAYGEVLRDAGGKFDVPTLNAVIGSMSRYLEDLLAQR